MAFRPQEVIRRKRDGQVLTEAEIREFVFGVVNGGVADAQVGAFTMATYLKGMTREEIAAYVLAMRDTGKVVDWTAYGVDPAKVVEKHSSGGVGDEKVTLLIVPIIASLGLYIPNMSAWGLDYCPGESDMLDSVPGYVAQPRMEDFARIVATTGGGISAPTPDLAPADTEIFRVRDVTATVESVALISGSILSKKFSVAPSRVVMSVGCGDGSFMHTIEEARELATTMRDVMAMAGIPSVLMITDLTSILGTSTGAAVEMVEVADFLSGAYRDPRTLDLVLAICSETVVLAGVAPDIETGRALALEALDSGRAAAKFDEILHAQGGPAEFVANAREILPVANVVAPVFPDAEAWIADMNTTDVGCALVMIGGGRTEPGGPIDYTVGFTDFKQVGDRIAPDAPLCTIHAASQEDWDAAAAALLGAMVLSDSPTPPAGPIVRERYEGRP